MKKYRRVNLMGSLLNVLFCSALLIITPGRGVNAQSDKNSTIQLKQQIVRYYTEQKGDDIKKVRWRLFQDKGFALDYESEGENHLTRTDENLCTLSWEMFKPSESSKIHANRKENTITISGIDDGKKVDKCINIDEAPWFQATSLSLKKFVLSDKNEIEFWTLRPGHYKAYKMKAKKVGREFRVVEGEDVETVKIELRLKGVLGSFWKSHYWYRISDGVFMRFEGTTDASGDTKIVVNFYGAEGEGK